MAPPPDLPWAEETVDGVAVRFQSYRGKTTVWVEGAVDAPVKGIEATVSDAAVWRRLLPWITDAAGLPAPAGSADGVPFYAQEDRRERRVRLRIAPPNRTAITTVVRLRPYAEAASSSCCFGLGGSLLAEDGGVSLGIGDFSIVAYPDGDEGTVMQIVYQLERERVPQEIADHMLSAEDEASVFAAIGRAARRR
jgi:hypothetical protein